MAVHDKSEEYCYRTKCPKCGKDVFRGRYNGGIYWVESLGDPWPNHPCFRSAVRKKRIDWRKIFDDHHERELDRILGASATKAQPVSTPRKQSPMVATAARPIVEKPSKESKPLVRPRIFELVGIDGKRKPLERQELSGMPVRKLAGPNNVPTPWGVSMMEVFKNKGLAVPGVSAEGFLIVRFRRGSVARIEWRELCDAEGRPRAFFILKLGSSILGIKDVRIVVEGAKVRRKIDHIQTIELHQSA